MGVVEVFFWGEGLRKAISGMASSWYIIYIRPLTKEGTIAALPSFPTIGKPVVNFLTAEDKKHPLFPKILDSARPAWAPDFLRLGFEIVWQRDGLPMLAKTLGLMSREQAEQKRTSKRILTFNDVWVLQVEPGFRPMYCPPLGLSTEDWWMETRQGYADPWDPYLAPGMSYVISGAERMVDVVARMLNSVGNFPRPGPPNLDKPNPFEDFVGLGPLVPTMPRYTPQEVGNENGPGSAGRDMGYAGLELFRYT